MAFREDFIEETKAGEHDVLRYLIDLSQREYDDKHPKYMNAIVEDKEHNLFPIRVEIQGRADFDLGDDKTKRRTIRDLPYHPRKIERLTLIIDDKEFEFVSCQ